MNIPLIDAVINKDVERIKSLLEAGVDIEFRDDRGRTALMAATQANAVEIAQILIDAGADVNARDNIQDSPYLLSGARGYNEILRLTLDHGADLASTNRYGGTALIPACERGHVETVQILLDAGVNADHINNLGWTGLLEAIILSDGGSAHAEIVQLLIKDGADVNLADKDGVTPLQHARQRRYTRITELLEAAGAH